jgi:hypothetical protein
MEVCAVLSFILRGKLGYPLNLREWRSLEEKNMTVLSLV